MKASSVFFTVFLTLASLSSSAAAVSPQTISMQAQDAYLANNELYIKYQASDKVFYANATLPVKAQADAAASPESRTSYPAILLEDNSLNPWTKQFSNKQPLTILESSHWHRLTNEVLSAITPKDGNTGSVIDFLYEEEYFLFYDKGALQIAPLPQKPPALKIGEVYDFDHLVSLALPVLEAHVKAHNIKARRLLLNTGRTGLYAVPFVYVDLDKNNLQFLRYIDANILKRANTSGGQKLQTTGHLIRSNTVGIANRPVTSLKRLFFRVTDTTLDTITPNQTIMPSGPVPPLANHAPMDLIAWEKQLDDIIGKQTSKGSIKFLIDGQQYFPRLIDAMLNAKTSVDMQTYIFDNDDYAIKIADVMKKQSKNVDIRVLADGFGTIGATTAHSESLSRNHEAPTSIGDYLTTDSKVKFRKSTNPWLAGDHSKRTIIDKKTAFIGGMNIGREYRFDWHDLMSEVRGPIVHELVKEFNRSWSHAGPTGDLGALFSRLKTIQSRADKDGYPIRILQTLPESSEIYKAQLAAIRNAKQRIYVQNAYFTDDNILLELVKARRRGVDVRVILPVRGDSGPINKSNIVVANTMLAHGIKVYIYPYMSHVKAAVYDGWICYGSANFDRLSFRVNRETNLATSDAKTVEQLVNLVFMPDMAKSKELKEPFPEDWYNFLIEIVADYL